MGVISMRKAEQNSTVQQLKSNLMGLGWGNYLISVCWKRIRLKEHRSRKAGTIWTGGSKPDQRTRIGRKALRVSRGSVYILLLLLLLLVV